MEFWPFWQILVLIHKVFCVVVSFNEYQTWKSIRGSKSPGVFLHEKKNYLFNFQWYCRDQLTCPLPPAKLRFRFSGNEDWQLRFPTTLRLIADRISPLISPFHLETLRFKWNLFLELDEDLKGEGKYCFVKEEVYCWILIFFWQTCSVRTRPISLHGSRTTRLLFWPTRSISNIFLDKTQTTLMFFCPSDQGYKQWCSS